MVLIPGGELLMGSERFYPEERPVHPVEVEPFSIDRTQVTHAQFAEFVDATGYVTVAERPLDPADFPGAPLEVLVPGGLVFVPPPGPVSLDDWTQWWAYVPGASWRSPYGPDAELGRLDDHPVTHQSDVERVVGGRVAGEALVDLLLGLRPRFGVGRGAEPGDDAGQRVGRVPRHRGRCDADRLAEVGDVEDVDDRGGVGVNDAGRGVEGDREEVLGRVLRGRRRRR